MASIKVTAITMGQSTMPEPHRTPRRADDGRTPAQPPAPPGSVVPPVAEPGTPSSSPLPFPGQPEAAGTPVPGPGEGSPPGETSPGQGRAQDPAGASLKAHGSHPAGSSQTAARMSEDRGPDSLDAHVRKLMKDLGLKGFHVEKSLDVEKGRTNVSMRGYPDWTIAGPRGQMWRELKAQRGKVTREQQEWLDLLAAGGGNVGVWRPASLLSGAIAAELTAISAWRVRRGSRCVCDAYGSCPQGCAMCPVCGGEAA